jgi:hypothetical protein
MEQWPEVAPCVEDEPFSLISFLVTRDSNFYQLSLFVHRDTAVIIAHHDHDVMLLRAPSICSFCWDLIWTACQYKCPAVNLPGPCTSSLCSYTYCFLLWRSPFKIQLVRVFWCLALRALAVHLTFSSLLFTRCRFHRRHGRCDVRREYVSFDQRLTALILACMGSRLCRYVVFYLEARCSSLICESS